MPPSYVLGLDLAQRADYSALIACERSAPTVGRLHRYDVVYIGRWQGEPYTTVPHRVQELLAALQRAADERDQSQHGQFAAAPVSMPLVVDITGVGVAVFDLLRAAALTPIGVTIHGGDQVTQSTPAEYRVPKRDLVSVVQVLLQTRRLRIAEGLPLTPTLAQELRNFRATINLRGHDSYGAGSGPDWRDGPHDDLVLAVALACWYGERGQPAAVVQGSYLAAAHRGWRDDENDGAPGPTTAWR